MTNNLREMLNAACYYIYELFWSSSIPYLIHCFVYSVKALKGQRYDLFWETFWRFAKSTKVHSFVFVKYTPIGSVFSTSREYSSLNSCIIVSIYCTINKQNQDDSSFCQTYVLLRVLYTCLSSRSCIPKLIYLIF